MNMNGERCAKPRKSGAGSDLVEGQRRPSSISPHVWWKMMTKSERTQWWLDYPDAKSATKSLPSVDCLPLGISSLTGATSRSTICAWSLPANDSDVSTEDGPSSEEDFDSSPDSNESRKEHCPWDDCNAFVQELDSSNARSIVCSP